jgi:hypothetical protein
MNDLPLEIMIHELVCDLSTYRALLAIPAFARLLTPSTRCDYMIRFGYRVEITQYHIKWTLNGKLHRTDGPAIIYANGTQRWYIDGKLHRTDGPAAIHADVLQEWYIDGKRHRTDGPAVIERPMFCKRGILTTSFIVLMGQLSSMPMVYMSGISTTSSIVLMDQLSSTPMARWSGVLMASFIVPTDQLSSMLMARKSGGFMVIKRLKKNSINRKVDFLS